MLRHRISDNHHNHHRGLLTASSATPISRLTTKHAAGGYHAVFEGQTAQAAFKVSCGLCATCDLT